jgi:hypothetical protein
VTNFSSSLKAKALIASEFYLHRKASLIGIDGNDDSFSYTKFLFCLHMNLIMKTALDSIGIKDLTVCDFIV